MLVIDGGRVVGGAIADYLAESDAGVVEFIAVAAASRGNGAGGRLLAAIEQRLVRDAVEAGGRLDWIFAEIDDPFRSTGKGGMDPFRRTVIWHGWGFRLVPFAYVQPALGAGKAAVETLLLLVKPMIASDIAEIGGSTVIRFVREYLHWAMRVEEPESHPDFLQMARSLSHHDRVRLQTLSDYLGGSDDDFRIVELDDVTSLDFERLMRLYAFVFTDPETRISAEDFRRALAAREANKYHLWAVAAPDSDQFAGLASFFTLSKHGFGGYVALTGSLLGKGLLRPLLARIERQMLQDVPDCTGWYIECRGEPEVAIFNRLGFRELQARYGQPWSAPDGRRSVTELKLLHKAFGLARQSDILYSDFLADLREIYTTVYTVPPNLLDPLVQSVVAGLDHAADSPVAWRTR